MPAAVTAKRLGASPWLTSLGCSMSSTFLGILDPPDSGLAPIVELIWLVNQLAFPDATFYAALRTFNGFHYAVYISTYAHALLWALEGGVHKIQLYCVMCSYLHVYTILTTRLNLGSIDNWRARMSFTNLHAASTYKQNSSTQNQWCIQVFKLRAVIKKNSFPVAPSLDICAVRHRFLNNIECSGRPCCT